MNQLNRSQIVQFEGPGFRKKTRVSFIFGPISILMFWYEINFFDDCVAVAVEIDVGNLGNRESLGRQAL